MSDVSQSRTSADPMRGVERFVERRGDRLYIWTPDQGGHYLTEDDLAAIAAVIEKEVQDGGD